MSAASKKQEHQQLIKKVSAACYARQFIESVDNSQIITSVGDKTKNNCFVIPDLDVYYSITKWDNNNKPVETKYFNNGTNLHLTAIDSDGNHIILRLLPSDEQKIVGLFTEELNQHTNKPASATNNSHPATLNYEYPLIDVMNEEVGPKRLFRAVIYPETDTQTDTYTSCLGSYSNTYLVDGNWDGIKYEFKRISGKFDLTYLTKIYLNSLGFDETTTRTDKLLCATGNMFMVTFKTEINGESQSFLWLYTRH